MIGLMEADYSGCWKNAARAHVPHEQMIQTCLGDKHENE